MGFIKTGRRELGVGGSRGPAVGQMYQRLFCLTSYKIYAFFIFFLSVRHTSDYFARQVLKKYRYVFKKCMCVCVCVYVRECVCVCV